MPICYLEKGKTATTAPVPAEAEDGNKFSIQRVLLCGSWPCNCLLRWCLQGSTVPIRITTNAKLNARLVWNVREVELLLFKKWRSGSRRRLYNATGSRYTSAVAEENEGEKLWVSATGLSPGWDDWEIHNRTESVWGAEESRSDEWRNLCTARDRNISDAVSTEFVHEMPKMIRETWDGLMHFFHFSVFSFSVSVIENLLVSVTGHSLQRTLREYDEVDAILTRRSAFFLGQLNGNEISEVKS